MLNKIIQFSIRNKLIIGIATLVLIGYGIYETKRLPKDAVPDITDVTKGSYTLLMKLKNSGDEE